jgi:pimeloyl-ACP methyl ester carboxylesterase
MMFKKQIANLRYSGPSAKHFCIFCGALALLLCSFLVAPNAAHAADDTTQCQQYVIPVHLSILDLTTYHVASWLCYNQTPGNLVQLTVHGATYNHSYWDFSCAACQPDTYSYTQYMGQQGYTTFNYDRLGYGESDHPLPELVTIQSDAYVLSQLISDLRTGSYGGPGFQKVILVGHSVGSAISIAEAANPNLAPPDGVVLTGFIHFVDPAELVQLATEIEPAFLDPDPRFQNLPPGYLTTDPGTRGQLFYYQPNADPNVIAEDESTKDVITDSELASFFTIEASTVSRQIQVPVLEVLGQEDSIFCLGTFDCTNSEAVQQYEAPFFSPQAQLQVVIIPQAGHDLNLQENASVWEGDAVQWVRSHFA